MSVDKRARLKQLMESGEIRLQPLSFPQRELWEATPVPVSDPASHICSLIYMQGRIPPEVCRSVIQRVVDRQEALRLSFLPGKAQALQMVRASGEANMRYRELTALQREPEAIEEVIQEILLEPFDLVNGPLYRVELLYRSPEDIIMVFAAHHAIADGWSLGVFVQDLWAACMQVMKGMKMPLPPVPMTYSAWSAQERGLWQPAALDQKAEYWKPHLAGAARLWKPVTRGGAGEPWALRRWVTEIPAGPAKAIQELARRTHTTLFSTLLIAFQTTLARWTGVEDIVVGSPVANRSQPAMRETMGYVSGVVPLRGQVAKDRPFSVSLKAMHETVMDGFANAMPFAELVRAVGEVPSPDHHPVFDVRFALQNHPVPDVSLPGISLKLRMRSTGTARFDLACEVTQDGDALEVVWLFRGSLFSREEIEKLDRMYQGILAGVCRSPETLPAALTV
jgi:hypothetical protein